MTLSDAALHLSASSFAPLAGILSGIFGLIGIGRWSRLRDGRGSVRDAVVFCFGCGLWAYACYVLLPWLADVF